MLEELRSKIRQRTYGRLTDLSLATSGGAIVVSGRADTYHTVQLALSAIKSYRSQFILPKPIELSVDVRGRALVLGSTLHDGEGKRVAGTSRATNATTDENRSIPN